MSNETKKARGGKATSAILAGLLTASMMAPVVALAANTASAGGQTGTGKTDLTMILEHDATEEFAGTEITDPTDPRYNPDGDDNDDPEMGDNLAFSVPSSINYVVKADGTMTGPDAASAMVQNHSNFQVHVSSVAVNENNGFTIVADATNSGVANAVDLTFGPAGNQLNAYNYLNKNYIGNEFTKATGAFDSAASYYTKAGATFTAVASPIEANFGSYYVLKGDATDGSKALAWQMAATNGSFDTTDSTDVNDAVLVASSGHVKNVSNDITTANKFGEIHWYLTPGAVNTISQ